MNIGGGTYRLTLYLTHLIFCLSLFAQDSEIELRGFDPGEIKYAGFTLNSDKSIFIEAVGAGGEKTVKRTKNNFVDPMNMFAYAWIIDARTRDLKWRMTPNNTDNDWWGAKYNRKFEGEVSLEKGEYELYYCAARPLFLETEGGYFNLKRLWERVFGDEDWWEDNSEKWYLKASQVDEVFEKDAVDKYQRAIKNSAIISLTKIGDSDEIKKGFSLKKSAKLKIYAIGEGDDGDIYDFCYIVNASSRERKYIMEENNTEPAGGALKNRVIHEERSQNEEHFQPP